MHAVAPKKKSASGTTMEKNFNDDEADSLNEIDPYSSIPENYQEVTIQEESKPGSNDVIEETADPLTKENADFTEVEVPKDGSNGEANMTVPPESNTGDKPDSSDTSKVTEAWKTVLWRNLLSLIPK